jgi:hypothetical protein
MLDSEVIEGLKERYKDVHPLMFQRSQELARTPGELFDILDSIPRKFPIIWNDAERRWVITDDIFQSHPFLEEVLGK